MGKSQVCTYLIYLYFTVTLLNFHPRYIGQSENSEVKERCVDLELDIEFAEERKVKAEEKIAVLRSIEQKIRTNLLDLATILVNSDERHKSTLQVMGLCKDNVESIIKRLTGEDLENILDDMDRSDYKPEGAVEDSFKYLCQSFRQHNYFV